jgi:hypothetical protein
VGDGGELGGEVGGRPVPIRRIGGTIDRGQGGACGSQAISARCVASTFGSAADSDAIAVDRRQDLRRIFGLSIDPPTALRPHRRVRRRVMKWPWPVAEARQGSFPDRESFLVRRAILFLDISSCKTLAPSRQVVR